MKTLDTLNFYALKHFFYKANSSKLFGAFLVNQSSSDSIEGTNSKKCARLYELERARTEENLPSASDFKQKNPARSLFVG